MVKRKRSWSLLSMHGLVLVTIARQSSLTVDAIADVIGTSRMSVLRALKDLQEAGMLKAERADRRNLYRIQGRAHFRHPVMADREIDDLLLAA